MSKIQDHPVMVTLTIAATLLTIIVRLAWIGQAAMPLAIAAGAVLFVAVGVSWIRARPKQVALAAVQPQAARHQTAQPASNTPGWTMPESNQLITSLPHPNIGQHLYMDAFEAMAKGEIHDPNYCTLVEVGTYALDWIKDNYHRYVLAYPGARGDEVKHRFAELAFQRIQANQMFSAEITKTAVPVILKYVTDRFAKEY